MQQIILASQSPRRKELLAAMGVDFEVIPSNFTEKLDDSRQPQEVAVELALGKARAVAEQFPDALVIGSDLIVYINGKQLEKPVDIKDAKNMLIHLAGKTNQVITSIVVICKSKNIELKDYDTTDVLFKPLDLTAIEAYVATGDPMDKAGAYGIQSGAAPLIESIRGNYDTIVGLPTIILARMLAECGVVSKPVSLTPSVAQT